MDDEAAGGAAAEIAGEDVAVQPAEFGRAAAEVCAGQSVERAQQVEQVPAPLHGTERGQVREDPLDPLQALVGGSELALTLLLRRRRSAAQVGGEHRLQGVIRPVRVGGKRCLHCGRRLQLLEDFTADRGRERMAFAAPAGHHFAVGEECSEIPRRGIARARRRSERFGVKGCEDGGSLVKAVVARGGAAGVVACVQRREDCRRLRLDFCQ